MKECVFKLLHYSDKDETPLENLLDMNKRIISELDEAFSRPQNFHIELGNFQQQLSDEITNKDNVVSLTDSKKKPIKTLADDFAGRF